MKQLAGNRLVATGSVDSETLDVAVLGAGPAGLSASIYLARAGLNCAAFSSGPIGGVLPEISDLANYPGFLGPGRELADLMKKQAEQAGARIEYGTCAEVSLGEPTEFTLTIDDQLVHAHRVLVATGSTPKKLGLRVTKPVSYCALCDGDLVKGKNVVVVGGANSAVQEALYLAKIAGRVTIITHSALKADQILRDKAIKLSNLEIIENMEPTAEFLDQFDHIFVYIGKNPASQCLENLASSTEGLLDENGYIITNDGRKATNDRRTINAGRIANDGRPGSYLQDRIHGGTALSTRLQSGARDGVLGIYTHETAVAGVFAAGDMRAGVIKQVVTAAADGVAAAIEIIDSMK